MVEKNKSKLNIWVLVFTILILLGVVAYFAFFNKDDIPEPYKLEEKVYVDKIEISESLLTINIGDEKKLNTIITPTNATNKNVTWISNNDSVVKVDTNGNITGLSVGKGTITVKTEDGKKTASCVVRVVNPNEPVIDDYIDVVGVSLNNTNITLLKGDSYTLLATINPSDATNKNVIWTSSNSDVATVDDFGKVTAIKNGSATITVKTKDGGKSMVCHVKVTDTKIPVTGVMLNKKELSLTKGESETIKAVLSPNNATNNRVTWSSSNPNVAKVDNNGNIKALSAGKTTITVKTADGNKTASCIVTVTNVKVDVTDIKLNVEELTITINNSKTINTIITPTNATNKNIKWTSSDNKIAKVDNNGKVTGLSLGKAIITAQTEDGNKIARCEVTITR